MFPLLAEKPILNPDKLDGYGAFFVVVSHAVDPHVHRIAPHQPGIAGLHQVGRRADIIHPRIEPEFVGVWIKDDWHPSWTAEVSTGPKPLPG
jgi:hypothetical protein